MCNISAFVCEKWYLVRYKLYNEEQYVKGYLINYNSGNIVLVSDKGIYHIPYKSLLFMQPCDVNLSEHDEKLVEFIKEWEKDFNTNK